MLTMPLRLQPGDDLRRALESALRAAGHGAAFVLSGIGSLEECRVRFAGADEPELTLGAIEILSLAGTLSPSAAHLHACLSTATGTVFGGHVAYGCVVRTTAEVLLAVLPGVDFTRERDRITGYDELVVKARQKPDA